MREIQKLINEEHDRCKFYEFEKGFDPINLRNIINFWNEGDNFVHYRPSLEDFIREVKEYLEDWDRNICEKENDY